MSVMGSGPMSSGRSNVNGAEHALQTVDADGPVEGRFHSEKELEVAEYAVEALKRLPAGLINARAVYEEMMEDPDAPRTTAYEVARVLNRGICHQVRHRDGDKYIVNSFGEEPGEDSERTGGSAKLRTLTRLFRA